MKSLLGPLYCFLSLSCVLASPPEAPLSFVIHPGQEYLQSLVGKETSLNTIVANTQHMDQAKFKDFIKKAYVEWTSTDRSTQLFYLLDACHQRLSESDKVDLIHQGFSYGYPFVQRNNKVATEFIKRGYLLSNSTQLLRLANLAYLTSYNSGNVDVAMYQMQNSVEWLRKIHINVTPQVDNSFIQALTDPYLLKELAYKGVLQMYPSIDLKFVLELGNSNELPKNIKEDLKLYGYQFESKSLASKIIERIC